MIRIHRLVVVDNEHLYGPGKRLLLFLQGCSIHCNGCVNKHLWSFDGGKDYTTEELIKICIDEKVEGVTFHGGEPLDQAYELYSFANRIKDINLSIVLFTGYLKKELDKLQKKIWNMSDIVIAGRFDIKKRNVNLQFRGSTNQKVYMHKGKYKNYKIEDGYTTAIICIDENGDMNVNGFYTDDIAKLVGDK